MNNKEFFNDIYDLFHTYKIGNIIEKPTSVTGGLLHKMFKVTTETAVYAVKCLNPSIMRRNGVLENMINSERIANAFSVYLPVVAALNFDNSTVLQLNDNYYMVYPWVEGESIFPPAISEKNCHEIGSVLGQIHHLNITIPEVKRKKVNSFIYNWNQYLEIGISQKASWIDVYAGVIDKLINWTQRVNDANLQLSEYRVISHRDLDPKNVMWNQGIPYLIDWEAGGYVNPYQELLEVLNYWADNSNGELDSTKFNILLDAYRKYMNTEKVDWDCVLDSGYSGMLGWLEYSLKRALGIEISDEEEIKIGTEQIYGTIIALEKYDKQMKTIIKWVNE